MCKALAAAIDSLAFAPAPPGQVTLAGAVSPDTRLRWTMPADARIADVVLYRRPAEEVRWARATSLGKVDHVALPSVVPDDFFFAVATAGSAGDWMVPQAPGGGGGGKGGERLSF